MNTRAPTLIDWPGYLAKIKKTPASIDFPQYLSPPLQEKKPTNTAAVAAKVSQLDPNLLWCLNSFQRCELIQHINLMMA
jgi:hypothetical protein